MFDFRLKVFHTVAKRLSFTKAANDLFITQPAVTKHIKELEQHFKLQFFERHGNSIQLTSHGQLMLKYTEQLFSVYREMEFELNSFSAVRKGRLHIGASSTISQYVIPATLAEFHKRHQDVAVTLMNGNTEQIEHALLENEIDLGIVEGQSKNKGIQYTKYLKDKIVLVSNSNNPLGEKQPLTAELLKQVPLLVREAGSGTLDVLSASLKSLKVPFSMLHIEMSLGSTEAIKTYLRNSDCMAFLSLQSVTAELSAGIFRTIAVQGLDISRFFYFIERQGTSERMANLFMQFAKRHNQG